MQTSVLPSVGLHRSTEDLRLPATQSRYAEVMAALTHQNPHTAMCQRLLAQYRFKYFKRLLTVSHGDPKSGQL